MILQSPNNMPIPTLLQAVGVTGDPYVYLDIARESEARHSLDSPPATSEYSTSFLYWEIEK